MVTIEQEQDPTDIISRLIPLGNKIGDDTEERLTISEVNNGINYIDDEEAIEKFGIIVGSQTWDDVSLASNLLSKGKEFQKENNRIKKAHKLSALDLSLIGLDIDSFELGNYHPVINPLMNIDETLRIIEKSIIIESPESSTLTIGDKFLDIKDYQLEAIGTAQEVATVTSNVQTVASTVTTLSVDHPVINPLMQIDETLRIIEKSIIIESPESSTLTIGDKFIDIKDYQLEAIGTAQEVATVKSNVQSVASNVTTLSVELTKTAESLQGANTSIADLTTIVATNIEATNAILFNLSEINNKLERLTKRLTLGV